MNPKKTLYLIDGSSYFYRAFYALGRLTNAQGMPTQAIYGFAQMLLKVIRTKKPDYLCVVFDPPGPTHRHQMYAAYKATRQKMPEDLIVQVPYIKELVGRHGIAQLEREGYEADDVIATLTRLAAAEDLEVVIVSGDKDLLQLVKDPQVLQWDPQKDRVFTEEGVAERFGITPGQIVDYLALVGDSTDNVPGVKGVGEKTARQLLQNWKSLDEIFRHLEEISPVSLRTKLQSDRGSAYLSRDLISLKTDVPVSADLEEFLPKPAQKHELMQFYGELNFKNLIETLRREWGVIEEAAPAASPLPMEMEIVRDEAGFDRLARVLEDRREAAVHVDSTDSDPMRGGIRGIAFGIQDHPACYVVFPQPDKTGQTRLSDRHMLNTLNTLMENPEIRKIGHNLKTDRVVLAKHGIQLNGIAFDTMIAGYLLDPGRHAHDLARLGGEYLGESIDPAAAGNNQKPGANSQEPVPEAPKSCRLVEMIGRLAPILRAKIEESRQQDLYVSLELPLIPVLSGMEYRGILVDAARLESLASDFEKAMYQRAAAIYDMAKEEFNIQSPKQLAAILFDKLGLPVVKSTKSGPSTDSSVLEELALSHPIVEHILYYRSLAKLKGTYADVLPRLVHPQTGRIHTSFNQAVTATGRLSSSEPNLQNIPIRSEEGRKIREAFIPTPGYLLLSADYSQIELRILAHLSRDEHLLDAFHSDGDVHRQTAAEIFGIHQHDVTPEMRRQAKTVNFGIIYGMGAFGLARRLGISRQLAKGIIDRYFGRYQGVKRYIEEVIEAARKSGYTETILGRRRPIPELASRNHNIRQQGERLAVNSPIQGSAADLIKKAMLDIDQALKQEDLAAAMLLQVHDELVFEVREDLLDAARELIVNKMGQVWDLAVPLKVDPGWGRNWTEAHP